MQTFGLCALPNAPVCLVHSQEEYQERTRFTNASIQDCAVQPRPAQHVLREGLFLRSIVGDIALHNQKMVASCILKALQAAHLRIENLQRAEPESCVPCAVG